MTADQVLHTVVTEKGVFNVTAGAVAGEALRRLAVQVLKLSPDYEHYKKLKYPNGTATIESRRAAYAFALAKASEIALLHYQRPE